MIRFGPKARGALLTAFLTGVVAGCALGDGDGEAMAAAIRDSGAPAIKKVFWIPGRFMDPPSITVTLVSGATKADAEALWCDVIVPAGGSHDYDPIAVEIYNDTGTVSYAEETVC